jgi:hypothetical protein
MSLVQAQLVDGTLAVCGTPDNPLIVEASSKSAEVFKSMSGSNGVAGDTVLIAGVAGKSIKVYALSAFAPNAATLVTAKFTNGAGGAVLYLMPVQTPNQATFAFGLAVSAPTFLFATSPGNALVLNLDSASQVVSLNISYWIE